MSPIEEARMQTLSKLILGHAVEFVESGDSYIRFSVGEHEFADKRSEYPSEKLIADLSLAAYALGYSPASFSIGDLGPETVRSVLRYGRYRSDLGVK
jgi:hypothetical protein